MNFPLKQWNEAKRGYRFGEKTFYGPRHLGLDLIVPEGTPVFAPVDCEIIEAVCGKQGGNTIFVAFNDVEYGKLVMRCMHLRALPETGKYTEGDIIGYTGNTGEYAKGAHLHLDISKEKVDIHNFDYFIDPEKYFKEKIINMVTYKKENEDRIYALIGGLLIPFAASLEIYLLEFKDAEIETLNDEEFNKYKVSKKLEITSKE